VKLGTFLPRHGPPVLPEDMGLDIDRFAEAVLFVPRTGAGRYTILEYLDLGAGVMADALQGYLSTVRAEWPATAGHSVDLP
jgi:glycerol-1-phosphate dehydrogenase [NAD(P)+]